MPRLRSTRYVFFTKSMNCSLERFTTESADCFLSPIHSDRSRSYRRSLPLRNIANHVGLASNRECIVDPVHKAVRSGAAELHLKVVFRHFGIERARLPLNIGGRPYFVWSNNLPIIDKKDGDLRRIEDL